MKKNPKKAVRICLIIYVIIFIILAICGCLKNVGVVEKYGIVLNEGRPSILEISLLVLAFVLIFISYIIDYKMSRCPKCNKYIHSNINTEYCPYCATKLMNDEK